MLIHIGYHKTASTWLQKIIFHEKYGFHQALALDEIYKLIVQPSDVVFDPANIAHALESRMSQSKLTSVVSHERFCGDPFTGSKDTKAIANRLYALFPQAKVLILVRSQADLIKALYKTYVIQGGRAPIREFLSPPENEVNQWFNFDAYKFHYVIEYYQVLYGKESVLIVPFEVLKKDNQAFVDKLNSFVGNKQVLLEPSSKINVGLSDQAVYFLRWVNVLFSPFSVYPLNISKNILWRGIRSILFKTNTIIKRVPLKKSIYATVHQECEGIYGSSNAKLQNLIDDDLQSLGYPCQSEGN